MAVLFVVNSNYYRHLNAAQLQLFPRGSKVEQCANAVTLAAVLANPPSGYATWLVSSLANQICSLPEFSLDTVEAQVLK